MLLRRSGARYCLSAECQRERHRERERERRQDPTVRERHRERERKRYQDPTVREREREYRQDPTVRERQRGYGRRRRALKRSVAVVPYRDRDIFERDRWLCGICGKRVNKRLKHPDPLSASVDHILPLSHGGHDVPSNVQCAHLRCNVAKGNRAANDRLQLPLDLLDDKAT